MKRSPLKRKTPLRRSGRIRSHNPERIAKRRERDFGELAEYVRSMPCCVCRKGSEYTQACHVKSRGTGGHAWLDNGDGNLLNMCATHHHLQHLKGWGAVFAGGRGEAEDRAKSIGLRFQTKVENS